MNPSTVLIDNHALSLMDAYQLCAGKLMCQDNALTAPTLIDFAQDYGVVGPSLFLHRLVADSRSSTTRLTSSSGQSVRLPGKRVSAPPKPRLRA